MANEEHLKILKQGAKVWNRWREDNLQIKMPDLSRVTLIGLDLNEVNLRKAIFNGSQFFNCTLDRAILKDVFMHETTLTNTSLIETNLTKSHLLLANFNMCDLTKAILEAAAISFTTFHNSVLDDTDFSDANLAGSSFSDVDLNLAKGLESLIHRGSSTIGIDTLYKSAGKIPEIFLRGCGVPDDFITFIPSIIGAQQAIQFYSCFISYSTKDEEFARRLHSRMRDEKLRVWFAPEDMKGGRKFYEQIEQAIHMHDRLLVILSEESMCSKWVKREIQRALKTGREQNRQKLFPIGLVDFEAIRKWECLDTDTGDDLAEEVRSFHIPDFSNWKDHDSFEKEFARLLRDLRAEEERQARERAG